MGAKFDFKEGGSYEFVENFPERYIADLTKRPKLKRKLKVVAACGNGTAGAFAPKSCRRSVARWCRWIAISIIRSRDTIPTRKT